MSYPLTQNLILQKTKMSDMRYVRKLNVCGAQTDDIGILMDAPNLEICSLSVNGIEDLHGLSNSMNLKELYMRKNAVHDIRQVLHLSENHNLEVLNLADNPITSAPHYRKYVISAVPSLKKLDDQDVSPLEREESTLMFPDLHLERPPSPANNGSPARPQTARRSPPASPNDKVLRADNNSFSSSTAAMHAAAPHRTGSFNYDSAPSRNSSFAHEAPSRNNSFSSYDNQPAVAGARNAPAYHPAEVREPQPLRRNGSGLAETKRREVSERKKDEAAVIAVNTLLSEMSPEGLREVQRHLNSLLR